MATPVPIQKRQEATETTEPTEPTDQGDQSGQSNQNSQSSADPCSESALDDNVPTTSEGQDVKVYAIPVPVQKRQGHNCPPSSPEINQSDTFPVSSDPKSPDGLKPFNCP
ncbi:6384_t:CDS:2 [Rhizophagus irregularis]|nr:6384_t:CDS:2 [Rhizophagus irregularis]